MYDYLKSEIGENYDVDLSELFPDAWKGESGAGETLVCPYKMEDGKILAKEWRINDGSKYLKELGSEFIIVHESNVPKNVSDILGTNVGYTEIEYDVSSSVSEKVYEKNADYYVSLSDMYIDDGVAFIDYFGDKGVDLMELPPSKELRQINPCERFTWIYETSEVKGNWVTISYSNPNFSTLSVIQVKVEDSIVTDIKINGFDY